MRIFSFIFATLMFSNISYGNFPGCPYTFTDTASRSVLAGLGPEINRMKAELEQLKQESEACTVSPQIDGLANSGELITSLARRIVNPTLTMEGLFFSGSEISCPNTYQGFLDFLDSYIVGVVSNFGSSIPENEYDFTSRMSDLSGPNASTINQAVTACYDKSSSNSIWQDNGDGTYTAPTASAFRLCFMGRILEEVGQSANVSRTSTRTPAYGMYLSTGCGRNSANIADLMRVPTNCSEDETCPLSFRQQIAEEYTRLIEDARGQDRLVDQTETALNVLYGSLEQAITSTQELSGENCDAQDHAVNLTNSLISTAALIGQGFAGPIGGLFINLGLRPLQNWIRSRAWADENAQIEEIDRFLPFVEGNDETRERVLMCSNLEMQKLRCDRLDDSQFSVSIANLNSCAADFITPSDQLNTFFMQVDNIFDRAQGENQGVFFAPDSSGRAVSQRDAREQLDQLLDYYKTPNNSLSLPGCDGNLSFETYYFGGNNCPGLVGLAESGLDSIGSISERQIVESEIQEVRSYQIHLDDINNYVNGSDPQNITNYDDAISAFESLAQGTFADMRSGAWGSVSNEAYRVIANSSGSASSSYQLALMNEGRAAINPELNMQSMLTNADRAENTSWMFDFMGGLTVNRSVITPMFTRGNEKLRQMRDQNLLGQRVSEYQRGDRSNETQLTADLGSQYESQVVEFLRDCLATYQAAYSNAAEPSNRTSNGQRERRREAWNNGCADMIECLDVAPNLTIIRNDRNFDNIPNYNANPLHEQYSPICHIARNFNYILSEGKDSFVSKVLQNDQSPACQRFLPGGSTR